MTKPCFISYVKPICGGLFFLSANEGVHCQIVSGLVSVPQVSVVRLKVFFVRLKICDGFEGPLKDQEGILSLFVDSLASGMPGSGNVKTVVHSEKFI